MVLVNKNLFPGLWQGPVDHQSSSVINAIYDSQDITNFGLIGDSVFNIAPPPDELLPQVSFIDSVPQESLFYGVLVGGDREGVYPSSGEIVSLDPDSPSLVGLSGDTVRVCTQGRCIANVENGTGDSYNINDPLRAEAGGHLVLAISGSLVVARALQQLDAGIAGNIGFIAVDIQREGILP